MRVVAVFGALAAILLFSASVQSASATEYYVRADGAVSVVSAVVSVSYNVPGNLGSVKATVPAGYSFDPATATVVPTTPAYLQNIIAHVITTKPTTQNFKVGTGKIVVKS